MKPFLPKTCESVLDIGCGLAAVDVLLSKHYGNPMITLVDQDKVDANIHYGFRDLGSFYNSFALAGQIMKENGVTNYSFIPANTGADVRIGVKQDLIISLLSCGYHYPVDFYLDRMVELLSPRGRIIIDIRENTDGVKKFKRYFSEVETISNYNKSFRICARAEARVSTTTPARKKVVVADPKVKRDVTYPCPMRWEAVLRRIPEGVALRGAEIGVLHGDTAFRILRDRPMVTHTMIDPWVVQPRDGSFAKSGDNCSKKPQGFHDTAFEYTKKRVAFAGKRAQIVRGFSLDVSKTVPDGSLDYCFIDGDHSYDGCMADIKAWRSKVRPGGWIGGHDYGNKRLPGVKQAVDESFQTGQIETDVEDTWFVRT